MPTYRPLIGFEPEWPREEHDFGHGVSVIPCTPFTWDEYEELHGKELILDPEGRLDGYVYARWGLRLRLPPGRQEVPPRDLGVDLNALFEDEVIDAFLISLHLVRPASVRVGRLLEFDQTKQKFVFLGLPDQWLYRSDDERHAVEGSSYLLAADIDPVAKTFRVVWQARGLHEWWERTLGDEGELFCQRLVNLPPPSKVQRCRELIESLRGRRVPAELMDAFREYDGLDSVIEGLGKGEKNGLREVLRLRAEHVSRSTRLGRSLLQYELAIKAASPSRFLLMMVVLETLVGLKNEAPEGKGERLARRMASVLYDEGSYNWRDCFEEIRGLYRDRNDAVHGNTVLALTNPASERKASLLVRTCLIQLIRDEALRRIFLSKNEEDAANYLRDHDGA